MQEINKRGELTAPELAKLILAILGMICLVVLGASLYSIFHDKTKTEQAKSVRDEILALEKEVLAGNNKEYLVIGPKGWFITTMPKGSKQECVRNFCLCICEREKCDSAKFGTALYACEESRAREILFPAEAKNIEISKVPLKININQIGDKIMIRT